MRNTLKKVSVLAAAAALSVTALTACGSDDDGGSSGEGQALTIGYIPWDEDIVVSYLWQNVLEEKGYEVELQQLDVAPTFVGLAAGDIDIFFDTWLPTTHEDYWKKYGDQLEDLGSWYDSATLNIAVPEYVEGIESIGDLEANADKFDGKIVGIESGAGLTRVTRDAIKEYGLDSFELQTSSTSAMLAALQEAIDDEEPIVVTLWHPHWAYAEFPLRDLTDPEGVMGGAESIHTVARDGFTADHGDVAEWVKNFSLTDEQLASLEATALRGEYEKDTAAGVAAWIEENQDVVNGMTD